MRLHSWRLGRIVGPVECYFHFGGFSGLFSSALGTADCTPYDIELPDPTPVRSSPYRCVPPKLAIFRTMVNELLEQGVVRPSKSPYASPAFLVPKSVSGFRMMVDYRKVNSKILFDSHPMPTIEQFGGAVIFSVLDLNSTYHQILLSAKSWPFAPRLGSSNLISYRWASVWDARG